MLKSFSFRSRTNLPCLSVAMKSKLTSFTRACRVIMELCGSSAFATALLPALYALRLGDPDTYADWAGDWATSKKVASKSAPRRNVASVYFMPKESIFCTLKQFWPHSQAIGCTQDAEIGSKPHPAI